jgi:hypothetical protein
MPEFCSVSFWVIRCAVAWKDIKFSCLTESIDLGYKNRFSWQLYDLMLSQLRSLHLNGLKVFGNEVLRRIFGPVKEKVTWGS